MAEPLTMLDINILAYPKHDDVPHRAHFSIQNVFLAQQSAQNSSGPFHPSPHHLSLHKHQLPESKSKSINVK